MLEALEPLTYRWPDGEVRLEPGKPVSLPDERARRLLAKAQGKVRAIELAAQAVQGQFLPDAWIAWHSPLFGECRGQLAMAPENGWLVVRCHSVTGDLALIRIGWDVRVIPGPPPTETSPPRPPTP